MSEKRFTFGAVSPNVAMIKDNGQGLDVGEIVALLNQLYDENRELRQELKEKQEDEKEYAREILRLNKLVKEYSEIRQLGGDY